MIYLTSRTIDAINIGASSYQELQQRPKHAMVCSSCIADMTGIIFMSPEKPVTMLSRVIRV